MDVWVLIFFLGTAAPLEGGFYQSRERCEDSARMQLAHWQRIYGRRVIWRCEGPTAT
jgi:hypothetical protein